MPLLDDACLERLHLRHHLVVGRNRRQAFPSLQQRPVLHTLQLGKRFRQARLQAANPGDRASARRGVAAEDGRVPRALEELVDLRDVCCKRLDQLCLRASWPLV